MSKVVRASVSSEQLRDSYAATRSVQQRAEQRMERVNRLLTESKQQKDNSSGGRRAYDKK
jgi:hypothetical protein